MDECLYNATLAVPDKRQAACLPSYLSNIDKDIYQSTGEL